MPSQNVSSALAHIQCRFYPDLYQPGMANPEGLELAFCSVELLTFWEEEEIQALAFLERETRNAEDLTPGVSRERGLCVLSQEH